MDTNLQRPQRLFAQPVRYEIPAFQRRYVWKQEEQWEPLWNDVEQLAETIMEKGRAEPHFMGAVVFQQRQVPTGTIERRIVVDGQQRLTTLQLLIDAIQEVLEERGHASPAKRLAALVENQEEFRDGDPDNAFKVWPTVVDRVAFRHAMNNGLSANAHAASRIVRAHDYFMGQAAQWLDRFPKGTEENDVSAVSLEKTVRVNLELVVIDLGEDDDPHVIFETLNARGTPLLQSDMVKNKVLHDTGIGIVEDDGGASEDEKRLWPFHQDDWWAQDVGRGLQRRPRVDVYLNHWLTLRNRSEMKPYDEFNAFTKYSEDQRNAGATIETVARDMGEIGGIYYNMEEMQLPHIGKFLERRRMMNVGVITPLLLWLLSNDLPSATLSNCVTALESFLVRRVVCGLSARSYGDLFVGLIAKLTEGSADHADRTIVSYLAEQTGQATLWPTDEQMRERFVNAPLYQYLPRGRLAMVLSGVEEELRSDKAESRDLPGNLHIEHIMPQAWQANWPLPEGGGSEDIERRERTIHTIGNLTLVNNRLNASLSNAPWRNKKKTLADHSVLFLNKHLVNEGPERWDEDAIEERARWLCERATKVWPHRGEMAKPEGGGSGFRNASAVPRESVGGVAISPSSSDPQELGTQTSVPRAYSRFWDQFMPAFQAAHPGWRRGLSANRQDSSIGFPALGPGRYRAGFHQRIDGRHGLRVEVCIKTKDVATTNAAYDALRNRNRHKIEAVLGTELVWERLEMKKTARISLYFPDEIRISDERRWPEAQAWIIGALGRFRRAFDPALEELGV